jgi:hypothetical protein
MDTQKCQDRGIWNARSCVDLLVEANIVVDIAAVLREDHAYRNDKCP